MVKVADSIRTERDLILVSPKPADRYSDVALTSLTAYSLFWLHEWNIRRTIEAIAILNWRLFPTKFAMVGYPEYPDAFRTNRSLLQMQPKYRNLLTGAASKGFSLNENGMNMAKQLISTLDPPSLGTGESLGGPAQNYVPSKKAGLARTIEPQREMERLRKSKLFEKWKSGTMGDRDLIHVHALPQIFDHTPASMRKKAMKELETSASKLVDEEAQAFLSEVKLNFPKVLG
jgi:hypothetical protein